MNVAARMAARAERSQRRRNLRMVGYTVTALAVGGGAGLVLNEFGPTAISDHGAAEIEVPAVVDGLGHDVAADCVERAEAQTGLAIGDLPRQTVEDFAAACALQQLRGPSEATIQQIADRMQGLTIDQPMQTTGVTRGTAAPQP